MKWLPLWGGAETDRCGGRTGRAGPIDQSVREEDEVEEEEEEMFSLPVKSVEESVVVVRTSVSSSSDSCCSRTARQNKTLTL